jgi:putative phosphoribosyl transferase
MHRTPQNSDEVVVPVGGIELRGTLAIPDGARGLVIFAHGSGGSRSSPRNRYVAEALRARALGTLLFDLLTEDEEHSDRGDASLRFDVEMLAERLLGATRFARLHTALPIGCFGASTGAAAALIAAAEAPDVIRTVVSRGGRPDLAGDALARVESPTLLIIGGADEHVLQLNRAAAHRITARCDLAIVQGATHLFDEPGALEEVADLAGAWFSEQLAAPPRKRAARGTGGSDLRFADRREAGRRLAKSLAHYQGPETRVFGLPRGGVPVADEVARALHAPLDVWLVRKIGLPHQPELGMGAIAEGGSLVLDRDLVEWCDAPARQILAVVHRAADEIRRRVRLYRSGLPAPAVDGKTVVFVDDGIATGGSFRAVVHGARKRGAARVVVAAPVATPEAVAALRDEADEVVILTTPAELHAVGAWYRDFRQLTDDEVVAILLDARRRTFAVSGPESRSSSRGRV